MSTNNDRGMHLISLSGGAFGDESPDFVPGKDVSQPTQAPKQMREAAPNADRTEGQDEYEAPKPETKPEIVHTNASELKRSA